MGATLPMLTAWMVRRNSNVGASIGALYFINTIGAATGALATGFFFFYYLEINEVIYFAAALNFLVSGLVAVAGGDKK
jgi:hypothetical protein